MKQETLIKFESEDKRIAVFCHPDTSYASLHDFMMYVKGHAVDKMVEIHKQELELAEKQKQEESSE